MAIEEGFLREALKSIPRTDITILHVRESDRLVSPAFLHVQVSPGKGQWSCPAATAYQWGTGVGKYAYGALSQSAEKREDSRYYNAAEYGSVSFAATLSKVALRSGSFSTLL